MFVVKLIAVIVDEEFAECCLNDECVYYILLSYSVTLVLVTSCVCRNILYKKKKKTTHTQTAAIHNDERKEKTHQ
jgi:hypothetical protein